MTNTGSATSESNEKEENKLTKGKRQARKPYRKSPDAPKRFRSSYILFFEHHHKKIYEEMKKNKKSQADGTSTAVPKLSKKCSEIWRNLPLEERAYWDRLADEDKKRYIIEKSIYRGPWQVRQPTTGQMKKRDPTAPKRNPSAFLLFTISRRAEYRKENPGVPNKEISRVLGKEWKEMSDERKAPYVKQELIERDDYFKRKAQWEENGGGKGGVDMMSANIESKSIPPKPSQISHWLSVIQLRRDQEQQKEVQKQLFEQQQQRLQLNKPEQQVHQQQQHLQENEDITVPADSDSLTDDDITFNDQLDYDTSMVESNPELDYMATYEKQLIEQHDKSPVPSQNEPNDELLVPDNCLSNSVNSTGTSKKIAATPDTSQQQTSLDYESLADSGTFPSQPMDIKAKGEPPSYGEFGDRVKKELSSDEEGSSDEEQE